VRILRKRHHKPEIWEKSREIILSASPQPFESDVFTQNMNGAPGGSKSQASREAKPKAAYQNRARWNGGVMVSLKNLMLGAAIVVGGMGLGAAPAQAARIGVYVRGPVAYVPPSPGPGYIWVNGYYANGYWVPGYWNAPAVGFGVRIGGPVAHFDRGPVFHGRFDHFRR
jgi:hypothetical protein